MLSTLEPESAYIAFNLNLVSELAPLHPGGFPKLRDATGRSWTVSPGQAQWWKFKAANFASVLLFKMGKFYEMFEMDAHVGASDLGKAVTQVD